jgi:hypothetical protein
MKSKYVLLLAVLLVIFGCKKNDPVSSDSSGPSLNGKVVDAQGNPVDSVGFHYTFQFIVPKSAGVAKTCPSTPIYYTLPQPSHVKLELYRWYTREYIATLLDDTLAAGTYQYNSIATSITNGVYIYRLFVNGAAEEHTMVLIDVDYASLVQRNPLAMSNASGEFSIPIGVFGIGIPFAQTSDSGDTLATTIIPPTITAVLYKSGYGTITKSITIDTTKNLTEQFQFSQ